eukprot:31531-Pelagococcus_subviridis.AAC.9
MNSPTRPPAREPAQLAYEIYSTPTTYFFAALQSRAVALNATPAAANPTAFTASATPASLASAIAPSATGPIINPTSPHDRNAPIAVPRALFGATSAANAAGAGPISACDAAHATHAAAKTFASFVVATAVTAAEEASTPGRMTAARDGVLSARYAAGATPASCVAAIAANIKPTPCGVYPCSVAATRGSSVARPPAPLKKSAALSPDTARKSFEDSSVFTAAASSSRSRSRSRSSSSDRVSDNESDVASTWSDVEAPAAVAAPTVRPTDATSDTTSSDALADGSVSGTLHHACAAATPHNPPTNTNGDRHPKSNAPTVTPPSTGPIAAPSSVAAWFTPSVRARVDGDDASIRNAWVSRGG